MAPSPSPDPSGAFAPAIVDSVAYAIGKVVATATVEDAREFRRMDALGKASAIHTMALGMVGQLQAEAVAAIGAFLRAVEQDNEAA